MSVWRVSRVRPSLMESVMKNFVVVNGECGGEFYHCWSRV